MALSSPAVYLEAVPTTPDPSTLDIEAADSSLALAVALWCDYRVLDALEELHHCYRLYVSSGRPARAAWVAGWIAFEEAATRGNAAVARGWFRRAERLLADVGACPEKGWLDVWQAAFEGDPERLAAAGARAAEVGRYFGDADLELLGHAERGLALVVTGRVDEGMTLLDEAMAGVTAGEATAPVVIGDCFCAILSACEQTRDYQRAEEWCRVAIETTDARPLGFLKANCLASYGWILGVLGRWNEGESRLRAALRMFESGHQQLRGDVIIKLADLKRRQGRTAEAQRLLRDAADTPAALQLLADLALDAHDTRQALRLARQLFAQTRDGRRTVRAVALQLVVRAAAAEGEIAEAEAALEALESDVATVGTTSMIAALWLARGAVLSANGLFDEAAAACHTAAIAFGEVGATFDHAQALQLHADCLESAGSPEVAAAVRSDARRLLNESDGPDNLSLLSQRELEVLRLMAAGLSNAGIAEALGLSPHTVHHHVANILTKLDVPTRAAAAAEGARLGIA